MKSKSYLKFIFSIFTLFFVLNINAKAVETTLGGNLSGNFQMDAQYYKPDSLIGAQKVSEKILSQGFLNLIYTQGAIELGVRYEAYYNPILGIDPQYKGSGFPYQYITYHSNALDITAGNFYEQFGSGLIFRSYEERALGFDNAMSGFRVKFRPSDGIEATMILGKQRTFWGLGDGNIRGGNLNFNINKIIKDLLPSEYQLSLGFSGISRFQADQQNVYNLPENVFAYSSRLDLQYSKFNLALEYAGKNTDPSAANKNNFNPGYGLILNSSVYGDGWGWSLNAHKIDNMDFRSDRDALTNKLLMSFVPPVTRQHTYRLATLYPYGTILTGEAGLQTEFSYKFKKGTMLGGDYGTNFTFNISRVNSIDTTHKAQLPYDPKGIYQYESPVFGIGNRLYFQDINFDFSTKFSKTFKASFAYLNVIYDKDILEHQGVPTVGKVKSNIIIVDMTYNIDQKKAIRTEIQHAWAKSDSVIKVADNISGNWFLFLAEYTVAPSYYFTVYDEYNYGNPFTESQLHYLNGSFAYIFEANRLSIAYGRQRGGILCVGGVCRPVPASNGFTLNLTSSF